jgi:FMN reductase
MMENKKHMRIVLIGGSVRPDNLTAKAMAIAADEIKKHKDITLDVFDPAHMNMPQPGKSNSAMEAFLSTATKATGAILVTPEYNGSYSSIIKLLIEQLGYPSVLAGKPVGLIGVASGRIGAIKSLEHLSSVCVHNGMIVLPGFASVAEVHKVFDEKGRCLDRRIEDRLRAVANNLINYIRKHIYPTMNLEEIVREGKL